MRLQAVGQFGGVDAGCGVDGFSQHHNRNSDGFVCAIGFLSRGSRVHREAGTQLGGGTEAVGHTDLQGLRAIGELLHRVGGHVQDEGIARLA